MKWSPRPYQLELVEFILTQTGPACWAKIGSGKTSASLAAMEIMTKKAGWRHLVVAPKFVALHVWKQECEKWGFDLRVSVIHGDKKLEALRADADVYVINYDGLMWLRRHITKDADEFKYDTLFLDESSKCRNTDTNRFKLLRDSFLPRAKKVVALSGTPKPNGEINLFGQYRLLDGGKRLGKYVTAFRNRFCYQTGYGGHTWELLPGAGDLIREAVQDVTIVVDSGRVDIAHAVYDFEVPLPDEVKAQYRKLERDLFLELESANVTAVNAAAKVAKLRQFVSGAVYVDETSAEDWSLHAHSPGFRPGRMPKWAEIHDARIEALDSFVDQAEGPVLLFANFNHEFERIQKAYPDAVVFSRLSDRMRGEAIDQWNRGKIDLLCAHPASAGHGLNLQHGGHEMLWFSLLYDLELYQQAIGRLARQGQERPVRVTRFVSPGTIDDMMVAALGRKAKGQLAFLDAIRNYALKSAGRSAEK